MATLADLVSLDCKASSFQFCVVLSIEVVGKRVLAILFFWVMISTCLSRGKSAIKFLAIDLAQGLAASLCLQDTCRVCMLRA